MVLELGFKRKQPRSRVCLLYHRATGSGFESCWGGGQRAQEELELGRAGTGREVAVNSQVLSTERPFSRTSSSHLSQVQNPSISMTTVSVTGSTTFVSPHGGSYLWEEPNFKPSLFYNFHE